MSIVTGCDRDSVFTASRFSSDWIQLNPQPANCHSLLIPYRTTHKPSVAPLLAGHLFSLRSHTQTYTRHGVVSRARNSSCIQVSFSQNFAMLSPPECL